MKLGHTVVQALRTGEMAVQSELEKTIAEATMRERTARMQAERMPRGNPNRRTSTLAMDLAEALHLFAERQSP